MLTTDQLRKLNAELQQDSRGKKFLAAPVARRPQRSRGSKWHYSREEASVQGCSPDSVAADLLEHLEEDGHCY